MFFAHVLTTIAKLLGPGGPRDLVAESLFMKQQLLINRFRRQANLRVLGAEVVKAVPHAPLSHPFGERLIGTIRREHLGRVFFWNARDLQRKLEGVKMIPIATGSIRH
ncbi:hypothetical protein ACFLQ0_00460 [Nitrospinota bacterium]